MNILYLSIITAIGIGTCVSFGILILSTPHNSENVPVAGPPHSYFMGVAVNPVTDKVYVCNYLDDFVYVYGGHYPYERLGVVPVHGEPWDVAVNPLTNKIYVVNMGSDDAVSVIDGATDSVMKTINAADMGKKPPEMVFDAFRGGKTYKIWPAQVAVNPETNRIYVSDWNYGDGVVTVIDDRTDQVIDSIAGLGGGSYGIGVNPNTDRIYVDNVQWGYKAPYEIAVIDGENNTVVNYQEIDKLGSSVAVNPQNDFVYATGNYQDSSSLTQFYIGR
ncbi:MAG: YncE family protein [Thaumarchaeota archaeon]|nr:YncE family protein [Nitrososphaerota archaeon]